MFQDRWYQTEAVEAGIKSFKEKINSVIIVPTGGGKSIILAKMSEQLVDIDPTSGVLILSHDKNIINQNSKAVDNYIDGFRSSVYCAGLDRKEIGLVTCATIQSIAKIPELFKKFNYVIVDEVHLVNHKDEGQYRKFLNEIDATIIGLTATNFRLNHGYLHKGDNTLFDSVCYDLGSFANYNRLVAEGYLSEIFSKPTSLNIDLSEVLTKMGDFEHQGLKKAVDRESITTAACIESAYFGKNFKTWLCFAIDIEHCENIAETFNKMDIPTIAIHSKMAGDPTKALQAYKNGEYRCAVNVEMLTTGIDIPWIDFIIGLRPTKSPVIHVQSVGRGGRVCYAEGYDLSTIDGRLTAIANSRKKNCLYLDFAGNTDRLGPINDVLVKEKGVKKEGSGEPIIKLCPKCKFHNHGAAKECCNCSEEFEFKTDLTFKASETDIVKKEIIEKKAWFQVTKIRYKRHQKVGNPDSMVVIYHCGIRRFKEWVALDSQRGQFFAKNWLSYRWRGTKNTTPETTNALLLHTSKLRVPTRIYVDVTDKFHRILDSEFS